MSLIPPQAWPGCRPLTRTTVTAAAAVTHTTAGTTCSARTTSSSPAPAHTAAQDDLNLNPFSLAAAGDTATKHASPVNSSTDSTMSLTAAVAFAPCTIVVATGATGGIVAPAVIATTPALEWNDCDAPFDVGIQLYFLAPTRSLRPLESDKYDASSSSEDHSIFIDFSRD
jgi:hypothetical protein